MKNSSVQFDTAQWRDWQGTLLMVPPGLKRVARSFVDLQEERHVADYDNHEHWTATEAKTLVNWARAAFQDWMSVRTDPIAGDYLLSMLLGKPRQ
jgi:hypothetical protein